MAFSPEIFSTRSQTCRCVTLSLYAKTLRLSVLSSATMRATKRPTSRRSVSAEGRYTFSPPRAPSPHTDAAADGRVA